MYEKSLQQAGLNESQSMVYELLLLRGEMTAGAVHKLLPLKRGLVYKVLDELVAFGVVEKKQENGSVIHFSPNHPVSLRALAEKKEQAAKDAHVALDGILPSLVSDFNILSGKPEMSVFEGIDGMAKVLNDSLTAKETIYSYVDVETVEKNDLFREANAHYMKKRDRLDIYKKLLVPDTPFVRDLYAKEKSLVTEVRVIPRNPALFRVSMQIYDNKISYIVLDQEKAVGVIVTNPAIYAMHRYLFETLYEKAQIIAR